MQIALVRLPLFFQFPQLLAALLQRLLQLFHLSGQCGLVPGQLLELLFPFQNAALRIIAVCHTQPIGTQPDSVAGNHRLVRGELRAHGQSGGEILGAEYLAEQRFQGPGGVYPGQKALFGGSLGAWQGVGVKKRDAALQLLQRSGQLFQIRDADRLERISQHGLNRALPALLHLQMLHYARCVLQLVAGQPAGGFAAFRLVQGCLLQRFEGCAAAAQGLQAVAQFVQLSGQLVVLFALRGDALAAGFLLLLQRCGLCSGLFQLLLQLPDLLLFRFRCKSALFLAKACDALLDLGGVLFQVLQPAALHLGALGGFGVALVEFIPLLLPLLHRLLRLGQGGCGLLFHLLGAGQLRFLLLQLLLQAGDGVLIGLRMGAGLLPRLLQPGQILLLLLAALPRVLDGLFQPGDVGPDAVETALDLVELLHALCMPLALLLQLRFGMALPRYESLQGGLLLAIAQLLLTALAIQALPAQRVQLAAQQAFLLLEPFVAGGRLGLPFQTRQLFVQLLAQIVEPVQVFARMADPVLGFTAPLLVLGNSCRLFQKYAHLVRFGLDEA